MRPFFLPLLLSLSLLLAAPPACAGLTLSQAEALWRQHSRELKLAAVAVDAAAADRVTAGQRPNPDLALNTLAISPWSGYRSGGWERKKMDTVLRVEQLIERGGKRELRQRGADERLAAVRFDAEEIGRQQLLDLRGAYFDLRLSQELPAFVPNGAKLKLFADFINIGNMLNDEWGDLRMVDFPYVAPIVGVALSGGKYTYSNFQPAVKTLSNSDAPNRSLWQVKFGLKYSF